MSSKFPTKTSYATLEALWSQKDQGDHVAVDAFIK